MTKLINPPPLVKDAVCRNCKHYLKAKQQDYIMHHQVGWMPLQQAREGMAQKGEILDLNKCTTATMAFCTCFPTWVLMADDSWCGQFGQRMDA